MNIRVNVNDDFESILICAIRYALGRKTYAAREVTEYITPFVDLLSDKTLGCIENDLKSVKDYGDKEIDEPLWINFLNKVQAELLKRRTRSN